MIRFILKASDPDDLKWAFEIAVDEIGSTPGTSFELITGSSPTRIAKVRVNPKSISVHCVRKNG